MSKKEKEEPKPEKKNKAPSVPTVVFALLFLGALLGGIYLYSRNVALEKTLKSLKQNTQTVNADETKQLMEKLGKIIELPKETPTVATVTDITKLQNQPFFKNAKNGFKVFLYTTAKKAILYDPVGNKVIDIQPINVINNASSSAQQQQNIKVALYNGTTITGFTTTIEKQLSTSYNNIAVIDKENAAKNDYKETVVIDQSGKQGAVAQTLAKALNGIVGDLPQGEKKAENADILIILGTKN
ncbi:MAG: LytR C-terminal domain-containing protein [Candidatus Levyibacteriota bacterium]